MEKFCGTPLWDLNVTWNTNNPTFTPCFEKTVLLWIPCTFLWLFASLEILYTFNYKNTRIPWNIYNVVKFFINTILVVVAIVDFVFAFNASKEYGIPLVEMFSPIVKAATFILSLILLHHSRTHGVRSSGLQFLFWFMLAVCNLPQLRTEIINQHAGETRNILLFINYVLYSALVFIMLILNCFADKTSSASQSNRCIEQESGFLSRIFYFWFSPLVRTGFARPLVNCDVWKLNPENSSCEVASLFDYYWRKSLHKPTQSRSSGYTRIENENSISQASILPALWKSFGCNILYASMLKLIPDLLAFLSPFLLGRLISFVGSDEYMWKGYLYATLLFLSSVIQSLMFSQYTQQMSIVGMKVSTALTSAIYKKSLRLSSNARKDSTTGEIVNLMSVDVQRFVDLMQYLVLVWSAPLQMCIAVYFLWNILGYSVFAGILVILLLVPLNGFLIRTCKKIQTKQMACKDQRLKTINEILNGIKVLKLYAWEPSFEEQVTKIRNEEIQYLKKITHYSSLFTFIYLWAPFIVCLASFATFVLSDSKHVLDSKTAFVSLSLLNILQFPLAEFPKVINYLIQTYVSMKRINKFMNAEELDPSNVIRDSLESDPVKIENGIFSWGSEDATLKNININIPSGSLVAIVGNVGSGKSSLLSALLGDMDKLSGQVSVNGSISYVPQQAWIQNATIHNNITFGKQINKRFYNTVISACALKPDFDILPGGDQTEIGEKGINLSGGQKQRVSLARAVYYDNDVYLLDDPLSAVDSHVGKHIFEKVIGPKGLLKHKTRLLVTHAINFLPEVDQIIVLKDGSVSEQGTYTELLDRKGPFAEFLLQYLNDSDEKESESNRQLLFNLNEDQVLKNFHRRQSQSNTSREYEVNRKHRTILENSRSENVIDRIIEEEIPETGNVKLSIYYHYFKSAGPFLLISTVIFNILYQMFTIGTNIWLSKWTSNNDINSANNTESRDLYLGVYGALGFGQAITGYLHDLAPQLGFWYAAKIMHEKMLKGIMRSPLSFFETTPIGRILARFSKDIDVMDSSMPWELSDLIFFIFHIVGTLIVISISTPIFTAVILPMAIIYYSIQRYYVPTSRQLKRLESISKAPIYSHFSETISGASTVRAYRQQEKFILESEEKVDLNQACNYSSIVANRWLAVRIETIGGLIVFFSALFAVIERDNIHPGIVGLSISYALQITVVLNLIVNMASQVETNIVAVERVKEYAENIQEAPWRMQNTDPDSDWPSDGQIQIDKLVLKYRSTTEPVLHKISCRVNSGEKIGVVGRTGAGKSTLALAIFRILEAQNGRIIINDIDISTIGLHTLRSQLTIIPQDPVLFSGSLRFNLDPFDKYTDEELWRSLERAHLKSFVDNVTAKLDYEVSEGGENLSVGQRQLVCLARALLRKSHLLILDEATAAVDVETDDLIQQTIRTEFASCTVLTIAHRLNTIMDSDKIMVLDKGKLVEFDSPTSLLQDEDSVFYSLAKDAGIIK
ncbi:multidrug resistance-associated protein 1-like [Arctopsyche grandis]|uniref:multidrug resistance-associated protein 1-like n=1 Tax=Arctopsyche grandis TaxID=121162 RepID=UPI00406D8AB6